MHFLARTAIVATIAATASAAPAPPPHLQTAVLAGGCFWGMEAVFEHVKGVTDVVSGFAGGSAADASYDKVSSEGTRHAEAVRITYDPSRVSYAQLLQIYFSVAHDPTQVNRQGPDVGPSYRSAIFPQNAQQRALASRMIAVLKGRGVRVATKLESGGFYPAEAYHQDFERKHPTYPYIVVNDLPKLAALKRKYPQWWKA
ncbi:peptide-methionine (S)-S-oxide reductase MsrA [Sphingomonas sp. RG327]|uniref:Peptide methionine sulfoxide reductase MsrA n=1 Tax=Sphingomonas anseongensis TaxID=2908207 RepID=A0ABT0RH98_9SPHN|nr:peptide-methionine (S)-S-oxide reductase MsrA [Sphingomonas anseongensis]MCL6679636.1 peptide-methionine (S)-S-oxide reductase MsrA [Sphingomonas anseongensis]